jgi:maleate isomerase
MLNGNDRHASALPISHVVAELDDGLTSLKKVALIVLSTDLISEAECRCMCPNNDVTLAATRIIGTNPVTPETLRGHLGQIANAASLFDPVSNVDVFAYSCTSGSAANRREDFESCLASVGVTAPLTSPLYGALEAFKVLGIRRIAMLTPYSDDVIRLMADYLTENEIEPVALASYHFDVDYEICSTAPRSILESAIKLDSKEAEACFIPCTGLRTSSIIERLERAIGKPVITAHQAMLWHALRLAGYSAPVEGFGQLMLH